MKISSLILGISVILFSYSFIQQSVLAQSYPDIEKKPEIFYNSTGKYYEISHDTPQGNMNLILPEDKLIFNINPILTDNGTVISFDMALKPELGSIYKQIGFSNQSNSVVFVYPVFTQAAYGKNGFYDYYNKKCNDKCLTVPIPSGFYGTYSSSIVASYILNMLNYSFVTDMDVDKNPDILKKYDTVITLHNEYVTTNEFNAITNHPHVIYLYPNALFAQVKTNYTNNTITLVKGHGYPNEEIQNGFNWKNDNTKFEYDLKCENWNFTDVDNGKMLNCYPDYAVLFDNTMLSELKEQSIQTIPEFYNVAEIMILSIIALILLPKLKIHY